MIRFYFLIVLHFVLQNANCQCPPFLDTLTTPPCGTMGTDLIVSSNSSTAVDGTIVVYCGGGGANLLRLKTSTGGSGVLSSFTLTCSGSDSKYHNNGISGSLIVGADCCSCYTGGSNNCPYCPALTSTLSSAPCGSSELQGGNTANLFTGRNISLSCASNSHVRVQMSDNTTAYQPTPTLVCQATAASNPNGNFTYNGKIVTGINCCACYSGSDNQCTNTTVPPTTATAASTNGNTTQLTNSTTGAVNTTALSTNASSTAISTNSSSCLLSCPVLTSTPIVNHILTTIYSNPSAITELQSYIANQSASENCIEFGLYFNDSCPQSCSEYNLFSFAMIMLASSVNLNCSENVTTAIPPANITTTPVPSTVSVFSCIMTCANQDGSSDSATTVASTVSGGSTGSASSSSGGSSTGSPASTTNGGSSSGSTGGSSSSGGSSTGSPATVGSSSSGSTASGSSSSGSSNPSSTNAPNGTTTAVSNSSEFSIFAYQDMLIIAQYILDGNLNDSVSYAKSFQEDDICAQSVAFLSDSCIAACPQYDMLAASIKSLFASINYCGNNASNQCFLNCSIFQNYTDVKTFVQMYTQGSNESALESYVNGLANQTQFCNNVYEVLQGDACEETCFGISEFYERIQITISKLSICKESKMCMYTCPVLKKTKTARKYFRMFHSKNMGNDSQYQLLFKDIDNDTMCTDTLKFVSDECILSCPDLGDGGVSLIMKNFEYKLVRYFKVCQNLYPILNEPDFDSDDDNDVRQLFEIFLFGFRREYMLSYFLKIFNSRGSHYFNRIFQILSSFKFRRHSHTKFFFKYILIFLRSLGIGQQTELCPFSCPSYNKSELIQKYFDNYFTENGDNDTVMANILNNSTSDNSTSSNSTSGNSTSSNSTSSNSTSSNSTSGSFCSDQLVFYTDACLIKCPNYRTFILTGPLTKFVESQNYCPSCSLKCNVTKSLTTHQTIIKQIAAGENTTDIISYVNQTNSTSDEICDGFHKITFDITCKGCSDRALIFKKSIEIARQMGGCDNTGLCPYLCPMWQNVPIVQKIYEAYFGSSSNNQTSDNGTSTTAAGNSTGSTVSGSGSSSAASTTPGTGSSSSATGSSSSGSGSSTASQAQSSSAGASSASSAASTAAGSSSATSAPSSGSPPSSSQGSSSSGSLSSTVSSSGSSSTGGSTGSGNSTTASTTDLTAILSAYSNAEICSQITIFLADACAKNCTSFATDVKAILEEIRDAHGFCNNETTTSTSLNATTTAQNVSIVYFLIDCGSLDAPVNYSYSNSSSNTTTSSSGNSSASTGSSDSTTQPASSSSGSATSPSGSSSSNSGSSSAASTAAGSTGSSIAGSSGSGSSSAASTAAGSTGSPTAGSSGSSSGSTMSGGSSSTGSPTASGSSGSSDASTQSSSTTTANATLANATGSASYPDMLVIAQYLLDNKFSDAIAFAQSLVESDICGQSIDFFADECVMGFPQYDWLVIQINAVFGNISYCNTNQTESCFLTCPSVQSNADIKGFMSLFSQGFSKFTHMKALVAAVADKDKFCNDMFDVLNLNCTLNCSGKELVFEYTLLIIEKLNICGTTRFCPWRCPAFKRNKCGKKFWRVFFSRRHRDAGDSGEGSHGDQDEDDDKYKHALSTFDTSSVCEESMKYITDECFLGCDSDHIQYVTRKFERRLIRKFKYCNARYPILNTNIISEGDDFIRLIIEMFLHGFRRDFMLSFCTRMKGLFGYGFFSNFFNIINAAEVRAYWDVTVIFTNIVDVMTSIGVGANTTMCAFTCPIYSTSSLLKKYFNNYYSPTGDNETTIANALNVTNSSTAMCSEQVDFETDACITSCPNYDTLIANGSLASFVANQNLCPFCSLKCTKTKTRPKIRNLIKQFSCGKGLAKMLSYISTTSTSASDVCDGFYQVTMKDQSCRGCDDIENVFAQGVQISNSLGGCQSTGFCPFVCPIYNSLPAIQTIYQSYVSTNATSANDTVLNSNTTSMSNDTLCDQVTQFLYDPCVNSCANYFDDVKSIAGAIREKYSFCFIPLQFLVFGGLLQDGLANKPYEKVTKYVPGVGYTVKPSMSVARTGFASCRVGRDHGKVYAIGGKTTGGTVLASIEYFDLVMEQWITGPSMTTPRQQHSACAIDQTIIVCGNSPTDASCEKLDTSSSSNSWVAIAPMPSAFNNRLALTINGFAYFIGGYTDSDFVRSRQVHKYNLATNTWVQMASMNNPREFAQGVYYENNVYVCGTNYSNTACAASNTLQKTCEIYSVSSNTWTIMTAKLNYARSGAPLSMINKKIYITGGNLGVGSICVGKTMECYDPLNPSAGWQSVSGTNLTEFRNNFQIVPY